MLEALGNLLRPENFLYLLLFLFMISVLVAVHELGHYLFARLFGMGVEEFAIGFGRKPIWTYARKKHLVLVKPGDVVKPRLEAPGIHGETSSIERKTIEPVVVQTAKGEFVEQTTNFTFRAWPLGGFVRINGMMPEEDGSETKVPGGFYNAAPWKRFIVLLAGPAFSVLAGIVMLVPLLMTAGVQKVDQRPVISSMVTPSPAATAGLKPGDRIVSIGGKPINTFYDMIEVVKVSADKRLPIVFERKGKRIESFITPEGSKDPSPVRGPDLEFTGELAMQAKIGVLPGVAYERLPLGTAVTEAFYAPIKAVQMLAKIVVQPKMLKDSVGGPITMLGATAQAATAGVASVVNLAAMLSISVGIFNILPVPPLDGGQMAIAIAEMFRRGRRLSMRVQNTVAIAGFVMVMSLFVFVMFVDVQRQFQPKDEGFKSPPPKAQSTDVQKK